MKVAMTYQDETKVLVVNDNPDHLYLMRSLLDTAGYNILTAVDGREGFEATCREHPQLIISDVMMPVVSGIELCRMVRSHEELRLTPILLVSAMRKDTDSAIEGLQAGADDYLESPYAPGLLIAKAARLIERYRAEVEIRHLTETLEERVLDRTAQLKEANRELEFFSYSVSHDLRTPLRFIHGFTNLLQERAAPVLDETSLGYIKVISDLIKQTGDMVEDLLEFSRMGYVEINQSVVDMDGLIREVISTLQQIEVKGRSVKWKIGVLGTVIGDPAMLRLVWQNLLSNAIKYSRTREDTCIEVGRIEDAEGEDTFFVRDNGVGFDMQYADRLFGIFQRFNSSDEFEGTGVGLASVRRIVDRHGGRAWAEGAPGAGAVFYFSIPKGEGAAVQEPKSKKACN
ncbi:MAG TPA: ATP-binding protein [Pyrinomonadaceae bacterium]|jgi:signal transduction histidine kinase|nr:ATP-binding protein [Pyrinomonadaceae bacterium]